MQDVDVEDADWRRAQISVKEQKKLRPTCWIDNTGHGQLSFLAISTWCLKDSFLAGVNTWAL